MKYMSLLDNFVSIMNTQQFSPCLALLSSTLSPFPPSIPPYLPSYLSPSIKKKGKEKEIKTTKLQGSGWWHI